MVRSVRTPSIAHSLFTPDQLAGWTTRLGRTRVDRNSLFKPKKRRKALAEQVRVIPAYEPVRVEIGVVCSK